MSSNVQTVVVNPDAREFVINGKTYPNLTNRVKVRQYFEIQELKAAAEAKAYDKSCSEFEIAEAYCQYLAKCAEYYLGMPLEEYVNIPYKDTAEILRALDAMMTGGRC